jgi:hypothetical protein
MAIKLPYFNIHIGYYPIGMHSVLHDILFLSLNLQIHNTYLK